MAIVEYDSGNAILDHILTYVSVLLLVLLSGLFSGLTLGLLGLDLSELEIVKGGGSDVEKRRAGKVMKMRRDGNRLLCTLLLGNVAVNALLSIFLSGITTGLIGFCASTALIVVFGEILPQAICSRHALKIGELALPIVNCLMVILAPAAVPLKTVLDKLLGDSVGTIHTKTEMMHYVKLQHERSNNLNDDARNIMRGALDMKSKTASEVMTPLEDAYMLEESSKLSFAVVRDIFDHGFSRVPVFSRQRQHVVGLLFVKDLIFVDPEDGVPLAEYLRVFERSIELVDAQANLDDVLRIFKRGRGHLALVLGQSKKPSPSECLSPLIKDRVQSDVSHIVGLVTLEDIIEEILGDEIIDETDVYVDVDNHVKVENRLAFDFTKLRRLDSAVVDAALTEAEVRAIAQHLGAALDQPPETLETLVRRASVVDHERQTTEGALASGRAPEGADIVYARGEPANFACLVLSGKLSVLAGVDGFRAEAGPWTLLGADALRSQQRFVPDFSAHVATDSVRCVYLSHSHGSNTPARPRAASDVGEGRSPSRERRRARRDRRVGDRRGARLAATGRRASFDSTTPPRRRPTSGAS